MISTSDIMDEEILRILKTIAPSKLFDYGCGHTNLIHKIASLGHEVTGFDISNEAIKQQMEKDNQYNINFLKNTEYIKFKYDFAESFDIVTSSLVLCVISDIAELKEVIDNVSILLKPRGLFVVSICNPLYIFHKESQVQTKIVPSDVNYQDSFEYRKIVKCTGNTRVDYHRPLGFYETLFSDCGFKIVEILQTPGSSPNDEFVSDFLVFKCIKEGN